MNYLSQSKSFCNGYTCNLLVSLRRFISHSRLKDCHKILEVDKDSSPKQIKDSFLRLSKVYHPDNKVTGSHTKFVELKEAFDEIKYAPTASPSQHPFHNRYPEDLYNRTYTKPREQDRNTQYDADDFVRRYQEYLRRHAANEPKEDDIWERVRQNRNEMFKKHYRTTKTGQSQYSPLAAVTIFLGAVAWIVIYSSVLLLWERKDLDKSTTRKSKSYEEYLAYKEYIEERKAERARLSQVHESTKEEVILSDE